MKTDENGRRVLCACERAFGLCPAGGGGICPFTLPPEEVKPEPELEPEDNEDVAL